MSSLLKAGASEERPAKVINITSVDGQRVNPWETYSYQASKAALIHLTRRMAARLIEDRIVVKALEAEQTTASGLVIPDTAKEKPQEGEVLAIGPGRIDDNGNRVPLDVAVGDKVIYSKYGGTEVKYAGDEYLILSARDVLAVVS